MTVYQVAIRYGVGADDFYNVLHYDITGDDPLDLQSLTDEIATQWDTDLKSATAGAVQFRSVTYRLDIEGSVGVEITPSGGPINGTASENQWIGQTAVLVQKRTNGIVRPNLGRAFVPGINSGSVTSGGEWGPSVLTAAEAFWDNIILVPFAGNGQAEMLLKATNPTAPNTNPYNSVTECVALPIPTALQSRKKGRGA